MKDEEEKKTYSNLAVEVAKITTGYFYDEADVVITFDNKESEKYEWDGEDNVFVGIDGTDYRHPRVTLDTEWLRPFWNCCVTDVEEAARDMWALYRITIRLDDRFLDWAKEHLKETFDKYLAPHFVEKTQEQRAKEAHARAYMYFRRHIIEEDEVSLDEMRQIIDQVEKERKQ